MESGYDYSSSHHLKDSEKRRLGLILSEMFEKQLGGLMNNNMAMFNKILTWSPFHQFMKHRGKIKSCKNFLAHFSTKYAPLQRLFKLCRGII